MTKNTDVENEGESFPVFLPCDKTKDLSQAEINQGPWGLKHVIRDKVSLLEKLVQGKEDSRRVVRNPAGWGVSNVDKELNNGEYLNIQKENPSCHWTSSFFLLFCSCFYCLSISHVILSFRCLLSQHPFKWRIGLWLVTQDRYKKRYINHKNTKFGEDGRWCKEVFLCGPQFRYCVWKKKRLLFSSK